ncbi:alpha-N-acetylgalactosaminide alpha-2,6-sialyltransferase 1-like isoform X1 [Poecilia latipinna]|uniref:alpha-N-acetylgalactosaminide alpha-2,6-sialyltransferase 1-like isoform X1 n=2 Tax=Poecilia latipinna TaxID=48699 RepID=UPI00072DB0BF|nr:PREDICTED: alpha-N-acetylgalactosaminide alpha-2,6-sialyltransferase 1-like isoform X1 [Poecilia latipinna]
MMMGRSLKLWSLVLVISATIIFFIMFLENSAREITLNYSWISMSGMYKVSGEDKLLRAGELLQKKGELATTNTTALTSDPVITASSETPIPMILKKFFKKLPQWSFEDIYNLDAPPRPMTCPQSLRNSKDEDFQKAFLPNIRMFLHKDNFNIREWNRLSHFNNPFGFMQMKHDDVMPVVKLISKPKEPLLLPKPGGDGCVHCAVVGTGGILNGSKMGAEIDAHDYVFRMNAAVVDGYEEDVGNRTSVYVHTAHSITASPIFYRKFGYKAAPHDEGIKYVLIPEGLRDFQWLNAVIKGERVAEGEYRNRNARTYYSGQYNETRFYVLHQDFLRYVRNRFLKSGNLNRGYWAIVRPTNGAFAIFTALHVCDTVSAYGFMTDDYSKYSNYYFQKYLKTNVVFYANHDYIMEKNLWKSFHERKIMKLFQKAKPQEKTEKQPPP